MPNPIINYKFINIPIAHLVYFFTGDCCCIFEGLNPSSIIILGFNPQKKIQTTTETKHTVIFS